ncbi:flavin reductase family protein [Streptomyces alkaliphilus]|uniref:flavin reductase family protein n=1 Tax=Streptomyces alkaliphilus TaxID=1472722 RepID=UPI001E6194AD|nr:flavin reductase family protein [Streptomyces alkaliphilus]
MGDTRRRFRDCLGRFATGVTVVTTEQGGGVHGATVGSFTSVSLDPPLVMVSLDRRSRICGLMTDASSFGVNILAAHQQDLALHFAGRPLPVHTPVSWEPDAAGPRLADCAAHLDCVPWAAYDGGDHVLHVGRVRSFTTRDAEPLIFHGGAFHLLDTAPGHHAWAGTLDGPADGAWSSTTTALHTPPGH